VGERRAPIVRADLRQGEGGDREDEIKQVPARIIFNNDFYDEFDIKS